MGSSRKPDRVVRGAQVGDGCCFSKRARVTANANAGLTTRPTRSSVACHTPGGRQLAPRPDTILEDAVYGGDQRYQSVFGAALLASIPIGATIVGLRYRLDSGQASLATETIDDLEIRLSTSRSSPGSLSTVFELNRGDDDLVVRSGSYTLEGTDYPSGNLPNGFGPLIAFSAGFVYQGGALLLEVATTSVAMGGTVDNVHPATPASESAYGTGADATLADQGTFNDLIVVELTYVLP